MSYKQLTVEEGCQIYAFNKAGMNKNEYSFFKTNLVQRK